MKTRAVLGSLFGSVAVLVIGWQAGSAAVASHTAASSGTTASGATTGSSSTPTPSTSTGSSSTPSTSAKAKTYTGQSASTQFGSVQVKITVVAGKITDVTAVHLTDRDGRSVQISNYAAPILRKEVLAAQSANVSTVGGATYTSDGYLTSLQSALDSAGIK